MNSSFNEQILADKLSKLNNTQQCIETLSHWCIYHRKNAEQVIQTWDKQFNISQKDQKISFLYLANDIIQNSRRNGTEFVNEFWKVLPAALKDVLENGDDRGRNTVSRLVNIWEQRRVFGSHSQGLKDLMLGGEHPPVLELNKKRSRSSVRIVKRDSRSIKIKLSIGGMAEKIVSALHNVLTERAVEDIDLNKCRAAVRHVEKLEKNVSNACIQGQVGDHHRESLVNELQEKEATLKQCIEKLKSAEANRKTLVDQLKTALQEQESELESVLTQLQLFEVVIEEIANMRRRLNNEPVMEKEKSSMAEPSKPESNGPSANTAKSAAAIAAEVADKLAASTHSQQIITSVLSTFAAEEAKSTGLASSTHPSTSFGEAALDRSAKIEKPLVVSDTASATYIPLQPVVVPAPHQPQAVLLQQPQLQNQQSAPQTHYNLYPAPAQQYVQPPGSVMVGLPYTYGALTQPPAPLQPQSHLMNLARPTLLTQQQQQPMGVIQQPPPPPSSLTMNPPLPMNQQAPQFTMHQPLPPTYRPLQLPGMAYYHPQTQ